MLVADLVNFWKLKFHWRSVVQTLRIFKPHAVGKQPMNPFEQGGEEHTVDDDDDDIGI